MNDNNQTISLTFTVKKPYNLIGKKYIIKDNSYIREIVNGVKKNYSCYLYGQTMEIISDPYITVVKSVGLDPQEERMIMVRSLKTGFVYEVLFAESWILD